MSPLGDSLLQWSFATMGILYCILAMWYYYKYQVPLEEAEFARQLAVARGEIQDRELFPKLASYVH